MNIEREGPHYTTNNVQTNVTYNNPNQHCTPKNPATCCDSQRLADTFTTKCIIDWRGSDHVHDSCRSLGNLEHCQENVQVYEESHRLMPDVGRRGSEGQKIN